VEVRGQYFINPSIDVFNHLNDGVGADPLNDTAHLKRTLEEKMKAREKLKQQIMTE
jgi:predicted NUDIX family phosphoesterase